MKTFRTKHHLTLEEWKKAIHHVSDLKKNMDKLEGQLYHIVSLKSEDNNHYCFSIAFNSHCAIYIFHFPSSPITPVSCFIEIAHELIERFLGMELTLKMVNDLQVIMPHNPIENPDVDFEFNVINQHEQKEDDEMYKVELIIKKDNSTFATMTLVANL